MKKSIDTIYHWFLLGLIILAASCGSDSSDNDKSETALVVRNSSKLTYPKGLVKINTNDSIKIKVESKDSVSIDSISFGYNGKQLLTSTSTEISLPSSVIKATGRPRLIVKVFLSNGKTEALYPKFNFLPDPAQRIGYTVTGEFPHKTTSYTQGLFFKDGVLYESTGQNGTSKVMTVDKTTGSIIKAIDLDNSLFGEGITYIGDSIYHLTYTAGQAYIYDMDFNKLHTFNYDGQGWGLASYGDTLLMTNGSENIYFRDKNSFEVIKTLAVHDHNGPVRQLNELEMINGYLYANVYRSDEILKIDISNGAVTGRIDLSGIFADRQNYGSTVDVLNGIAYLPKQDKMYVTGKLWPKLYEIELVQ
ncbi:MAG: glutaminyl-peptide cyclotransferase [Cyclobacteriaceae bacterium]